MADFFDMCDITKRQANLAVNEDPEVKAELRKLAGEIVDYWKSIAPVYEGPNKDVVPGTYRDSIHVHEGPHGGIAVIAEAYNAWFVEYGTNNIHESACRARTEAYFNKRQSQGSS